MALSDSPFKGEFLKGLSLQLLRALLCGWLGSLTAKGYFTSGQAEYILIGLASFLVTVGVIFCTAVLRYVRALALRNSSPDTDPKDIRQLGWRILGQILSNNSSTILKG